MTTIRPYRLLRDSDLRAVRERLRPKIEHWANEWFIGGKATGLETLSVCGNDVELKQALRQSQEFFCLTTALEPMAGIGVSDPRALVDLLLGAGVAGVETPLTAIEHDLVRAALDALFDALVGRSGAQATQRSEIEETLGCVLRPGSPAIVAVVRAGDCEMHCVLAPAGVDAIGARTPMQPAPNAESLKSLRDAILGSRAGQLSLPARLGEAEMSVSEFLSLEIGDVIVTDVAADAPIEVELGESPYKIRAYLGSDSGVPALQIIGTQAQV